MRRALDEVEWRTLLHGSTHAAFRLELRPVYIEAYEEADFARYRAGERDDPTTDQYFADWLDLVRRTTAGGKCWQRVRVQDRPLTDYQRYENWSGLWNVAAGEDIRTMTRDRAYEIGLLPDAGGDDWWLLDSARLLVTHYDDQHNRIGYELVTDPTDVVKACGWRDLALQHADSTAWQRAAG